jgi:peptidoglycan/xylan/chitin deacetylase (PgdA/CDA1 family)
MTAARRIRYSAASFLLPAQRLWTRSVGCPARDAFRILTLHHVRAEQFEILEKLLDYIVANHHFLKPEEAERMATTGSESSMGARERVPCLLTFDDGFQSNFEVAQSLLAPRGIHAIFFVLPGLIDAPKEARRRLISEYVFDGPGETDLALMEWDAIKSLRGLGHTIGSHTSSHRRLSSLSENDLTEEIAGSSARLRDQLGEAIHWFAYPFGTVDSMNRRAYEVVAQTYRFCCSAVRGVNRTGLPLALFRENIELDSPLSYQKFECEGGLDFYYGARRKKLVKMLAGD